MRSVCARVHQHQDFLWPLRLSSFLLTVASWAFWHVFLVAGGFRAMLLKIPAFHAITRDWVTRRSLFSPVRFPLPLWGQSYLVEVKKKKHPNCLQSSQICALSVTPESQQADVRQCLWSLGRSQLPAHAGSRGGGAHALPWPHEFLL